MNKLKTLKDLNSLLIKGKIVVDYDELKAEAVKRARYFTYKANQKGIEDNDIKYWTARRVEVMEFNNLTEEDLQEIK